MEEAVLPVMHRDGDHRDERNNPFAKASDIMYLGIYNHPNPPDA
jgi:hypothetical protein